MFCLNVVSYSAGRPWSGSLSELRKWKIQSPDTGELRLIALDVPTYVAIDDVLTPWLVNFAIIVGLFSFSFNRRKFCLSL